MIKTSGFSQAELDRFREHQRRSYSVQESIAKELRPGVTEKEVARLMRHAFRELGVRSYFHVPVALFGDRTAYPGAFGQLEALSTDRVLKEGDTVILDAAPVFDGYTVDTSLAFAPRRNETFERLDAWLVELRELVLALTRERRSMQKISWAVDDRIRGWGAENCHKKHIAAVLGHRVTHDSAPMKGSRTWGLAPSPVGYFLLTTGLSRLGLRGMTPNWNHTKACDLPPQPGLWAMEPHLGLSGVGVKFEEILVVTETDAYWLDDELPHLRRWARIRN